MEMKITKEYLQNNPDIIFVFGDNQAHFGKGGAASLRDEPNTYGFITKKYPNNRLESFYYPDNEYKEIFAVEIYKLIQYITSQPAKTFLISKLGSGLANRNKIFEKIIDPGLKVLQQFPNVRFLY